jgi:hypothetical protein
MSELEAEACLRSDTTPIVLWAACRESMDTRPCTHYTTYSFHHSLTLTLIVPLFSINSFQFPLGLSSNMNTLPGLSLLPIFITISNNTLNYGTSFRLRSITMQCNLTACSLASGSWNPAS